jgi:hypothetical protein
MVIFLGIVFSATMKPTIFLTCLTPFISRNILESGVSALLGERFRVVVFVPQQKERFFKERFKGSGMQFEAIAPIHVSRQDVLFRKLGASLVKTDTLVLHRRRRFVEERRYVRYALEASLSLFLSPFVACKRFARWIDLRSINTDTFKGYFDTHAPVMVFATDVFNNDDVHMLAEARRRGVRTVGMIRSWDNITNKGLFRVKPDHLVVHNEIVKEEAIRYNDILPTDVTVTGLPHFDIYKRREPVPRERFLKESGLSPKKKTLLIAPHGRRFHDTDWQLLQMIEEVIASGELSVDAQCIVRLPPNDTIDWGTFAIPEGWLLQHPGVSFVDGVYRDREATIEDALELFNTLYASDVVINYGSTISIDAAAMGKPVIVALFDGFEKRPLARSVTRFLRYAHVQKLLRTGGCAISRNKKELIGAIEAYLADPNRDRAGREKLVAEQVQPFDGHAAERAARVLREEYKKATHEHA